MEDDIATSSAELTNALGLHARPSVQFTRLAKTFVSTIEIATVAAGPWIDAKSIVKVMAAKAPKGATLQLRAKGPDAQLALDALRTLILKGFADTGVSSERSGPVDG